MTPLQQHLATRHATRNLSQLLDKGSLLTRD